MYYRSHVAVLATCIMVIFLSSCNSVPPNTSATTQPPLLLGDGGGGAPTRPETLDEAIAVLSNPASDYKARIAAIETIPSFSSEAKLAVDVLITQLEYDDVDVRERSAWVLGEIGSPAKHSVPSLSKLLLNGASVRERRRAAEALGKIGDKSAVPALATVLSETAIAVEAAKALGLLTGQQFPGLSSSGYSVENGTPIIVTAARKWWQERGQFMDWGE